MKLVHNHFSRAWNPGRLNLILISASILIICLIGPVSIEIGLIDISLQTFTIMAVCLIIKPFPAFILLALYLLLGIAGLPVFSGYSGGWEVFTSYSLAFLLLFPPFAFFHSALIGRFYSSMKAVLIISIISQGLLVSLGYIFLYVLFDFEIDLRNSLLLLPGLFIKAFAIAILNTFLLRWA